MEITDAQRTLTGEGFDPWGGEIKATDAFLDPVFRKYHQRLNLPNLFRKSSYHLLAPYVPREHLEGEVRDVLDQIAAVASGARGAP